jgi:hypothetical protein
MSKRSVKMNQTRKPVKSPTRPAARQYNKPSAGGKPVAGKPLSVRGRAQVKKEPLANLMAVRIVAGAAALLCAAGVTAVLVQGMEADTKGILLMLLLGVFIAVGIFTTINPQMVVSWVGNLGKK